METPEERFARLMEQMIKMQREQMVEQRNSGISLLVPGDEVQSRLIACAEEHEAAAESTVLLLNTPDLDVNDPMSVAIRDYAARLRRDATQYRWVARYVSGKPEYRLSMHDVGVLWNRVPESPVRHFGRVNRVAPPEPPRRPRPPDPPSPATDGT